LGFAIAATLIPHEYRKRKRLYSNLLSIRIPANLKANFQLTGLYYKFFVPAAILIFAAHKNNLYEPFANG
jgi:hypothetical protein